MDLVSKVRKTKNVAIFCRNHRKYLDEAVRESKKDPEKPITFRSAATWVSGYHAWKKHGDRKIYFVPIGEKKIEYEAILVHVKPDPKYGDKKTEELLKYCLNLTRNEGLSWNGKKIQTLYVVKNCRRLEYPIPFMLLTKLSDELPINENYGYSYSLVYEYCNKCKNSPCRC